MNPAREQINEQPGNVWMKAVRLQNIKAVGMNIHSDVWKGAYGSRKGVTIRYSGLEANS